MRRDKAMPSYHGGISDEDKSTSDEEGSATPSLISDPDDPEDTDQDKQANAHRDMRTDPEADPPAGARPIPQRLRSWIMRSPFQDRPEDKEEGEREDNQREERDKPQQKKGGLREKAKRAWNSVTKQMNLVKRATPQLRKLFQRRRPGSDPAILALPQTPRRILPAYPRLPRQMPIKRLTSAMPQVMVMSKSPQITASKTPTPKPATARVSQSNPVTSPALGVSSPRHDSDDSQAELPRTAGTGAQPLPSGQGAPVSIPIPPSPVAGPSGLQQPQQGGATASSKTQLPSTPRRTRRKPRIDYAKLANTGKKVTK